MSWLLDLGCTVAGGAAGAALYPVAARVPPAPRTPRAPAEGDDGAVAPAAEPDAPVPVAPPARGREQALAAAATALVFLGAAIRFGPVPALAPYCVFFCGLVLLSTTDLRVWLVPRAILYPWLALVAVGLLGASWAGDDWHPMGVGALCGVGAFAVFFAVWFVYPKGMGFGDVRLAGVIGLALGWLGPWHVYVGFLAAFVFGVVVGVVVMAVTGTGRKTRLPFGPALSLGAVVAVLWGGMVVNAWIGHGS